MQRTQRAAAQDAEGLLAPSGRVPPGVRLRHPLHHRGADRAAVGGAIATIVLARYQHIEGWLAFILAVLVFVFFATLGIVKARILYPRRIDDRYARLLGADQRFLASLPQFMAL